MYRLVAVSALIVCSAASPPLAQAQEAARTGSVEQVRRAAAEQAAQGAQFRLASHDSYGRLVFSWPSPVEYNLEHQGERIVLRFQDQAPPDISTGRRVVRNVVSIAAADRSVVIITRPGAQVRHFRIGTRIVLDVHDPAPERATVASRPSAPAPQSRQPVAPVAAAPVAVEPEPVAPVAVVEPRSEIPAPVAVEIVTAPAAPEPEPVVVAAVVPVNRFVLGPIQDAGESASATADRVPAHPSAPPSEGEAEMRLAAGPALPALNLAPLTAVPAPAPVLMALPNLPPPVVVPNIPPMVVTAGLATIPTAPAGAGSMTLPVSADAGPTGALKDAEPPAAEPRPADIIPVQQTQLPPPNGTAPPLSATGPPRPGPGVLRNVQLQPGQPIPPVLGGVPGQGLPVPMPVARAPVVPIPVYLDLGSGRLLQLPAPAAAVLAADPRIARVQPASPTSLFIMSVLPGRTNVIATAEDGTPIAEYDVTVGGATAAPAFAPPPVFAAPGAARPVAPSASSVESMIRRSVRGGEGVRVSSLAGRGYILNGLVPTASDAQRAEAIAKAMGGEDREVINNLSLLSSIQVNVRVRVAEISRTVTRDLGFNWDVIENSGSWLLGLRFGAAGAITQALGIPAGSAATPARYGGQYAGRRWDINSVIDALAQDNLVTVLAEPNLTAQSGEVASFLAGGEFPVPIPSTNSGGGGVMGIEFKQFGVSLAFVPTVLSPERLNLRVRPEVSELSEAGSISMPLGSGVVRIPALTVRRAETTVELGSGQSFAIAGLLSRSNTMVNTGLLGLGDIPVLGALFRSDRFRRNETELVIIVTPYLVRPTSDPRALAAPTDGFRPATDLDRILFRRQSARGGSATPAPARRPSVDAGFIVE